MTTIPTAPASTPEALRIGDAEREANARELAEHHVAGRLTAQELDQRLGATWSARTHVELAATQVDLPAATAPLTAPPRSSPVPPTRGRLHLTVYLVAVAGMWLIWAVAGGGHPWPVWPMLGWGLGLLTGRTAGFGCGARR